MCCFALTRTINFWINELSAFYYFILFMYFILYFFYCKDVDIVGCRNTQYVRIQKALKSANSTKRDFGAALPL